MNSTYMRKKEEKKKMAGNEQEGATEEKYGLSSRDEIYDRERQGWWATDCLAGWKERLCTKRASQHIDN